MRFSGLLVTFAVMLGPLAWGMLLNRRDRRRWALHGAMMKQFQSQDYRGRVAIRVYPAWVSRRGVVAIDLLGCARDEILDVMNRLSRIPCLSSKVLVEVKGTAGRLAILTFTVAVTSAESLPW